MGLALVEHMEMSQSLYKEGYRAIANVYRAHLKIAVTIGSFKYVFGGIISESKSSAAQSRRSARGRRQCFPGHNGIFGGNLKARWTHAPQSVFKEIFRVRDRVIKVPRGLSEKLLKTLRALHSH